MAIAPVIDLDARSGLTSNAVLVDTEGTLIDSLAGSLQASRTSGSPPARAASPSR